LFQRRLTSSKRKFSRHLILVAAALWIAAPAFPAAKELPPPADRKVDFAADIKPLFDSRCTMCHGAQQQLSGLRLDRREDALKGSKAATRAPSSNLERAPKAGSCVWFPAPSQAS
jgi:hypothetical protein